MRAKESYDTEKQEVCSLNMWDDEYLAAQVPCGTSGRMRRLLLKYQDEGDNDGLAQAVSIYSESGVFSEKSDGSAAQVFSSRPNSAGFSDSSDGSVPQVVSIYSESGVFSEKSDGSTTQVFSSRPNSAGFSDSSDGSITHVSSTGSASDIGSEHLDGSATRVISTVFESDVFLAKDNGSGTQVQDSPVQETVTQMVHSISYDSGISSSRASRRGSTYQRAWMSVGDSKEAKFLEEGFWQEFCNLTSFRKIARKKHDEFLYMPLTERYEAACQVVEELFNSYVQIHKRDGQTILFIEETEAAVAMQKYDFIQRAVEYMFFNASRKKLARRVVSNFIVFEKNGLVLQTIKGLSGAEKGRRVFGEQLCAAIQPLAASVFEKVSVFKKLHMPEDRLSTATQKQWIDQILANYRVAMESREFFNKSMQEKTMAPTYLTAQSFLVYEAEEKAYLQAEAFLQMFEAINKKGSKGEKAFLASKDKLLRLLQQDSAYKSPQVSSEWMDFYNAQQIDIYSRTM